MANRYALLVGTSEYHDEHFARLKTPLADVNVLADLLKDPNIGGYQVKVVLNQPFTTVLKEIVSFLKDKHRDDHLLLYFSGHGVLDEGGNLYLAAKDTERDLLSATALSNRFIKDEMDRSRAKRQVLILDCCHSGAFLKGTKGDGPALTQATFEGYGRAVLTAADSVQYALEGDQVDEGLELSLFTHFLAEGIQTGDADRGNDGWIELDEWFDYAFSKVRDHTDRQTPRKFIDNQYGELFIARNPKASVIKQAELSDRLRARIRSEYKPDRLEAIQELQGLLESNDPSVVMAAQTALEKISIDDDSLSIRTGAAGVLKQHDERQMSQKTEGEGRAREQAEEEHLAASKAEEKRLADERAEAKRQAALEAEQERRQAEVERLARQRAEQERQAREKAKAEASAPQPVKAGNAAGAVSDPGRLRQEIVGTKATGLSKPNASITRPAIWVGLSLTVFIGLVLVGGLIVGLIIRQEYTGRVASGAATQDTAIAFSPTQALSVNAIPAQVTSTSFSFAQKTKTPHVPVSTLEPTWVAILPALDTERIAFTSYRDGHEEIYVMNVDGSGQTRLTSKGGAGPTWSPDGTRIAFGSDRGGISGIFVMNADGSEQTRLTSDRGYSPVWSPEGTRIAFTAFRDGIGNIEIYVMNTDGSQPTRLTTNTAWDTGPAWSPDGRRIAFDSDREGNVDIYVMDADGSEQTRLTNNPADDYDPAWSPDGTRIAFVSARDGISEIYVMNADGSQQTRLTNNTNSTMNYLGLAWSPDGTRIAFTSNRDGDEEIGLMNADGSGQIWLTDNSANDESPAWQP